MAYDWYPIVSTQPRSRYEALSPLTISSVYDEDPYRRAIPPSWLGTKGLVTLFVNLMPDFRPPESDVTGDLAGYDYWLEGLKALVNALPAELQVAGLVSWGKPVWTTIRDQETLAHRSLGVMAAAERLSTYRQPFLLSWGSRQVAYYPFAHPSDWRNFGKPTHWQAFEWACADLANRPA